jgi:phosphosulfolactate synthase
MLIDGGLPRQHFRDVIESAGEYVDYVKFGWGTSIVSPSICDKIDVLRYHGIRHYFGGTLFEKHVLQGRFDEYRSLCAAYSCTDVEVSNGTIDLSNAEKAGYIRKLSDSFNVISEVGYKDGERSENLPPSGWIEFIHEDLDAGASLVTLEARESGRSGICRPDGRLRFGLIEEVLACGIAPERLLFEAPSSTLQSYFIGRIGPEVNLGNIAATDVIGVETLRLGLRADTLQCFEAPVP